MKLKPIFERINFAERYRLICDTHQEFDNRLRGTHKSVYEPVLKKLGYEFKYFSKGTFYQVVNTDGNYEFALNLVLKDGLVESLLYMKENGSPITPQGRLDFLSEDLGIPFERKRYNLPMYTSESELEEILREIFLIYEDIKREVIEEII